MTDSVDGKALPKFAYEHYEISELKAEGKIIDLDLRVFASRQIIHLDE